MESSLVRQVRGDESIDTRILLEGENVQHRQETLPGNISALIYSFHSEVGRLSHLLMLGPSSDILTTGCYEPRQGMEIRQCLRTVHDILSRQAELEFMCDGRYHRDGNTDDSERFSDGDSHREHLRHREEVLMFVDDLITLVCFENPTDESIPENTLISTIGTALTVALPRILMSCRLSPEQMAKLVKRLLCLIQDTIEEYTYNECGKRGSQERQEDYELLESFLALVTEEITVEQLQSMIDPEEMIPILQVPLELACLVKPANMERRPEGPPSPKGLVLSPKSLYNLRVLINFLMQNLNLIIQKQSSTPSRSPRTDKVSLRDWIIEQQADKLEAKRSQSSSSPFGCSDNGCQTNPWTVSSIPGDAKLSAIQDSSAEMEIDFNHILSCLGQYGTHLLDATMELLQHRQRAASEENQDARPNETIINGGCALDNGAGIQKTNLNSAQPQVESVLQMVHMSIDFVLLMDSENEIAADPMLSGILRSLWIESINFILDVMTDFDTFPEEHELQVAATEILFRLTASHLSVTLNEEYKGKRQIADDLCGITTLIFRLVKGPCHSKWREEGKDWVAFLLEKYSDSVELRRVFYTALITLTCSPHDEEVEDEKDSAYFSLLRLTGLDDCATGTADEHDEDPWKLYARDILLPSFPGSGVG